MYAKKATFAGGNFKNMVDAFVNCPGIQKVVPGFVGGFTTDPSYEDVIAGKTDHYLAVEVHYDEKSVSYFQLLDIFWRQIDPTDDGGQFAKRGDAYRTAIFYHDEEQLRFSRLTFDCMKTNGRFGQDLVTGILPATTFYPASGILRGDEVSDEANEVYEDERRRYLKKTWGKSYRKLMIRAVLVLFPCIIIAMMIGNAWSYHMRFAPWTQSYPEPIRERMLTAEEVAADAAWLVSIIEESHPVFIDIWLMHEKLDESYDQARSIFLGSASQDMSVIDFAMLCRRYVASLGDAHTLIYSPSGYGYILDLEFYWSPDGLILLPNEEYPNGAKVISLGGLPVEDIGQTIDSHFGIETESGRYYLRSGNVVSRIFHQAAGIDNGDSVDLELVWPDNSIEIVAFDYKMYSPPTSQEQYNNFNFDLIAEGEVALVTTYACVKDNSWSATLVQLREALRTGVNKIIVDLRHNGGGDSSVWDPFAVYLGMQEDAGSYGMLRRYSPLANATILRNQRIGTDYLYMPSIKGGINKNPYEIILLVEEPTFSSAILLAGYVKDGEFGTIIGREPRNTASHFGYPANFTLPNSHLTARVSTHYWLRPDVERDKNVEPLVDIEVPYGEDILERALLELGYRDNMTP